jgi:LPS-assembly protein
MRGAKGGWRKTGIAPGIATFLLSVALCLLPAAVAFGVDRQTVITADMLEYFSEAKKYVATGSVKIERDGAVIHADQAAFFEETSEVDASGNVTYDDRSYSIKADRAELNLETRTGKLFDAEVFFKEENSRLAGREIEKRGERYYYIPEGSFTTCDAPIPAWCFKAKDINAYTGEKVKARDASFRIKGLPVFYTPYVAAPILTERQSGFLIPIVGDSSSRGIEILQQYYLVIAENQDATFAVDYYSKRGVGTGIEYRFIEPGDIKNKLWVYHIRDTELKKDDWEIKGLFEDRHPGMPGGYLNIDYVNEQDFYRGFNVQRDKRTQRYIESTGEINVPFSNSRLYLLSQYWVDLENPMGNVPQKLPEAGYVLNYTSAGSFMYSLSATAANFWREDGTSAGRVDVYPKLIHSMGSDFVVTQVAALRGTSYDFYNDQDRNDFTQRGAFEYDIVGHTRLYRDYGSFSHVIEPSISYHFISSSENDLPVFDQTEFYKQTSNIEFSLLNRAIVKGTEAVALRVSQAVDTYNSHRPLLPLKMDLALRKFFPLALEATYNVYNGELETVSSDVTLKLSEAAVSVGQRYNRAENIMTYKANVSFTPFKSLLMAAQMWYDSKGQGLQDLTLSMKYVRQCWGITFEAVKRRGVTSEAVKQPGDFTVRVLLQLAGMNSKTS